MNILYVNLPNASSILTGAIVIPFISIIKEKEVNPNFLF